MKHKYDCIPTSEENIQRLFECELREIPDSANAALEEPITTKELYNAITQGKPHKAPGRDGICLEFYKKTWEKIK